MTVDWALHAAVGTLALAATCACWLASRAWRVRRRAPLDPALASLSLPWPLRIALWPAMLLAPLVGRVMPAARSRRVLRELEGLGLAPPLTAPLWDALRLVHAAGAVVAVALIPGASAWWSGLAAAGGWAAGGLWLRRTRASQALAIGRELPGWLDLMTISVEAGATLTSGIRLILEQAPQTPLRGYFERVMREVRSGRPRAQAFSEVADMYAVESLGTLAAALAAAEGAGLSLGQVLRTQAAQRTAERFARAERLAMQAPVKMLGPLILCIFPCTFIVLAVPIAVRLKEALGT